MDSFTAQVCLSVCAIREGPHSKNYCTAEDVVVQNHALISGIVLI